MYTTRAVEIFVKTEQTVRIPENSYLLSVRRFPERGPGIFLVFAFDAPNDAPTKDVNRKIYMVQLGADMPDFNPNVAGYIGSVLYEPDLVFHVWDCGESDDAE